MNATTSTVPQKLSGKTILGYSCAAFGFNMLWGAQGSFITYYYTQSVGISIAVVGVIAMVARLWDGFNDPFMGTVADKTIRKNGRYRPYLIWGILPLVISSLLLFTSPSGMPTAFKIAYAGVTYIAFGMSYTFINIPYMAMQSTLVKDPDERTKLINLKQIGAMSGNMLAALLVPMLSQRLGDIGYVIANGIFSLIMALGCLFAYAVTKPYIPNELPAHTVAGQKAPKIPLSKRFQVITTNFPLLIVMIIFVVNSILQGLVGQVGLYYTEYFMGRKDLIPVLSMLNILPMVLVVALVGVLAKKMEKRTFMIIGFAFSIVMSILQFFIPGTSVALIMTVTVLRGIGTGIAGIFVFSMVADCVDYAEWKTGEALGGMVFSTATFAQKTGTAFSAAIVGGVLTAVGFISGGGAQTPETIQGLRFTNTLLPAFVQVICIVTILFYPLSKKTMRDISADIKERREAENAAR